MPEKQTGRLLIIEDDTELNAMLSTYFQMQGYEVHQAHSGAEGVELARKNLPNLVLLDVMLPDLNGFDVCKSLRTTNRTRYIPITFLTQKDGRRDKVAGLELGADDYITKPFDLEELRLRVQTSIRRATRESLTDPRTGLPGRPLIIDRLNALAGESDWTYLDGHIEHVHSFKELYGFVATDEVMGFTARIFIEIVEQHGTGQDFIGHMDDDTFIVITYLEDPAPLTQALEAQFNEGVCMFYNFAERDQGYISFEDEFGEMRQSPLMTLQVKVAEPPPPDNLEYGV